MAFCPNSRSRAVEATALSKESLILIQSIYYTHFGHYSDWNFVTTSPFSLKQLAPSPVIICYIFHVFYLNATLSLGLFNVSELAPISLCSLTYSKNSVAIIIKHPAAIVTGYVFLIDSTTASRTSNLVSAL